MTTPIVDPVPPSAWPTFQPVNSAAPDMPPVWQASAILQPFSPPQSNDPNPATPFFELCIAQLTFMAENFFSAQITGCVSGRTWWYCIEPSGTQLSQDGGTTWVPVDMGWSLPTNWFGAAASNAVCCGAAPLNWMNAQTADWWRVPVPNTNPPAATWVWFDHVTASPIRMMFGQGPVAGPNTGDPSQLAVLQMFSFSYFPTFQVLEAASGTVPRNAEQMRKSGFVTPVIDGFQIGNPNNYQTFVFSSNFGMTTFMTPVNEQFSPLPTRVLYVWKPDGEYAVYSDRAQHALMNYGYNPGQTSQVAALLTGPAPAGVQPPANSDASFLITYADGQEPQCAGPAQGFDFPQEAPDWIGNPAVQATIQATIANNPVLCPNAVVTVFSVLFPPSAPNYPDSTYLWTWYAPQNASGTVSRPVTFMQSQSGVGVGTSLALADYYYHQDFAIPISPANFDIPSQCFSSKARPASAPAPASALPGAGRRRG